MAEPVPAAKQITDEHLVKSVRSNDTPRTRGLLITDINSIVATFPEQRRRGQVAGLGCCCCCPGWHCAVTLVPSRHLTPRLATTLAQYSLEGAS